MQTNAQPYHKPTTVARPTTTGRVWHRVALLIILALAAFLHFFQLEQEGYANLYYAAAVKSMLTSWNSFFFVSFDPGGFVTVDKPPLGLWTQAASATLFGFDGFSLLLPQAIAGVLSVLLLYRLVRRTFGPTAGLLAALTLAVTPISVAANRNNTMDSLLVLVLLLAAWAVIRATETGRLRWLLLGASLVGLGFNVKMLQAFLALPALYLLYLLAAPVRWWKRFIHLALATVLLLAVSLSWVLAVDLTPSEARPFVGSSSNNTVTDLIVGHNGLARLLPGGRNWLALLGFTDDGSAAAAPLPPSGGQPGRPLDAPSPPVGQPGRPPAAPSPPGGAPPGGDAGDRRGPLPPQGAPPTRQPSPSADGPPAPGARDGGFSHEIGEPGLLRLFNRQLAGQISWLLPLAGIGLLAAAWQARPRLPLARRHQNLLLWAAWLLPMLVFFSVGNLFHRYYLEMLAPAIAALVGAGVTALWEDYRRTGWRGWLLLLALVGSAAVEAIILAEFPEWGAWLTPLVLGLCTLAGGVLAAARLLRGAGRRTWTRAAATVVATAGVLALLIPMLVWAAIPVLYGGHAGLPYAGPDLLDDPQRSTSQRLEVGQLASYLQASRGDAAFLAATLDANTAAPLILATGEPVMAMGGFSGGDPILTVDALREMVADGTVRFFLVPAGGGRQQALTGWVAARCAAVPPGAWGSRAPAGPGGSVQLFDCGAVGQ